MAEWAERAAAKTAPPKRVSEVSGQRHQALERRVDLAGYAAVLNGRAAGPKPVQNAPNRTGLPDRLKAGVEALSGVSLDGVKVHYGSAKPAQLGAHAFAQGRDIHLAPGQERDLPHEAWHVVQQAQGRVRPTMQMKGLVPVNNEAGLEREADLMARKAEDAPASPLPPARTHIPAAVLQGRFFKRRTAEQGASEESKGGEPEPQVAEGPNSLSPSSEVSGASSSSSASSGLSGSLPVRFPSPSAPPPDAVEQRVETVLQEAMGTDLAPLGERHLRRGIRKLAEGPDIVYDSTEALAAVLAERLKTHAAALDAPKRSPLAQGRKINRIAGLLQQKRHRLTAPPAMAPLVARLDEILGAVANLATTGDLGGAEGILNDASALIEDLLPRLGQGSSRFMWAIFDIVSNFGPLAHALNTATGGLGAIGEMINHRLRRVRQLMARNPEGVTVVAHRGTGPTNRTMGGLIRDQDNRRLNRPAENSPAAFAEALRHAGTRALDGVECDIYLSSDGIPMLSHEGAVREQLSQAQKDNYPGLNEHTQIHDRTAAELLLIERKEKDPESRFMTLDELLEAVAPVARDYYDATGKAFRVEVEMKGAKVEARQDNPRIGPVEFQKNVARVVSRFHKRHAGLPVEIILFNNDAEQVSGYAGLRTAKTALGGTYTGMGVDEDKLNKGQLGSYIDELRYQFTVEFNPQNVDKETLKFAHKYLDEYIVTLVFGQEFAPPELGLADREPSEAPDFKPKRKDKKLTREFDMNVQRALERYASDRANLEKLQKLHILTDYPAKAAWIKAGLAEASQAALAAIHH